MSFSSDIKNEICKTEPEKDCCLMAELNALTQSLGSLSLQGAGKIQVLYRTGGLLVGRYLLKLLRHRMRFRVQSRIDKSPKFGIGYVSVLKIHPDDSRGFLRRMNVLRANEQGEDVFRGPQRRIIRRICCRKAFIRGTFLGCGSALAPEKGYHVEFNVGDEKRAQFLVKVLAMCNIKAQCFSRRGQSVVYLKNSEMITRLYATMGVTRALLKMEDIKTYNSVRREVTRAVNCDKANIEKQVKASQKQVETINKIALLMGLSSLPEDLEHLARIRLANQGISLEQVGALMNPPLSKSSVQNRFKKLHAIADSLIDPIPTFLAKEI